MTGEPTGRNLKQIRVDPAWVGFTGHFPGDPIVPAAVIIDWVLSMTGGDVVERARFHAPIRPGDDVIIAVTAAGGRKSARITVAGHLMAEVSITTQAPD